MTVVSESLRPLDPERLAAAVDAWLSRDLPAATRWIRGDALADLLRPLGPCTLRRGAVLVEWDGRQLLPRWLDCGRYLDLGAPGEP